MNQRYENKSITGSIDQGRAGRLAFLGGSDSDADLESSGRLRQPGFVDVATDVSVDGRQGGA